MSVRRISKLDQSNEPGSRPPYLGQPSTQSANMGRDIPGLYSVPVAYTTEYATIDADRRTVQVGDQLFEKPKFFFPRCKFKPMSQNRFWRMLRKCVPIHVIVIMRDHAWIELEKRHVYGSFIQLSLVKPE